MCECVCNQQYQNRIYDVPAALYLWYSSLHSLFSIRMCLSSSVCSIQSKKEIFCRSASSIEVYMAMDKHMHWLCQWHETPSKKIIIYSIGFLLGSFSKSSFSLFAFFVCLIVCLIHLLCDDLLAMYVLCTIYTTLQMRKGANNFWFLFCFSHPSYLLSIWREKDRERCLFLFELYHFALLFSLWVINWCTFGRIYSQNFHSNWLKKLWMWFRFFTLDRPINSIFIRHSMLFAWKKWFWLRAYSFWNIWINPFEFDFICQWSVKLGEEWLGQQWFKPNKHKRIGKIHLTSKSIIFRLKSLNNK